MTPDFDLNVDTVIVFKWNSTKKGSAGYEQYHMQEQTMQNASVTETIKEFVSSVISVSICKYNLKIICPSACADYKCTRQK